MGLFGWSALGYSTTQHEKSMCLVYWYRTALSQPLPTPQPHLLLRERWIGGWSSSPSLQGDQANLGILDNSGEGRDSIFYGSVRYPLWVFIRKKNKTLIQKDIYAPPPCSLQHYLQQPRYRNNLNVYQWMNGWRNTHNGIVFSHKKILPCVTPILTLSALH